MGSVTVGIDIGTTSVKAVAVDDEGSVISRVRIPHRVHVPRPDRMEHDASRAWRRGPMRALAALGKLDAEGVAVAAMVPSMTAVDGHGRPLSPGLLYGDARGRTDMTPGPPGPEGGGEVVGFLRWTAAEVPTAHGFWPAQAVANFSLGGPPAVDLGVAFTSSPLYGRHGWDADLCASAGARPEQLPPVEMTGTSVGRIDGDGPQLAPGSVDVWCEQLVAGAEEVGDVHVICGSSLIIWAVSNEAVDAPGLWSVGHGNQGRHLIGGASNAGGLFLDWVGRLAARPGPDPLDPSDIPVWVPYPRGERTPYHDPGRRASLHGLDLTHGSAAVIRAAWEASGFVVRHHLELAGVAPRRIVATGGGTQVPGWMQALADATGVPVHVAAGPEGAARGAAFLARLAAGIESDLRESTRWARTARVVEPDPTWQKAAAERYELFLQRSESE